MHVLTRLRYCYVTSLDHTLAACLRKNLDAMTALVCLRCIAIDDFPPVAFKIGNGETKNDRDWLKKKKEYFEKIWNKNGPKILKKIEDSCGDTFTSTSKQHGILVLLQKKTPNNNAGFLKEDNPS